MKIFTYKARYLGIKQWDHIPGCFYTVEINTSLSPTFFDKLLKISSKIYLWKRTTRTASGTPHTYKNIEELLSEWELLKEVRDDR